MSFEIYYPKCALYVMGNWRQATKCTCFLLLQGTRNLVAAALQAKVKKFVLVTSIGTDDPLFPLNLFFGVSAPAPLAQFV